MPEIRDIEKLIAELHSDDNLINGAMESLWYVEQRGQIDVYTNLKGRYRSLKDRMKQLRDDVDTGRLTLEQAGNQLHKLRSDSLPSKALAPSIGLLTAHIVPGNRLVETAVRAGPALEIKDMWTATLRSDASLHPLSETKIGLNQAQAIHQNIAGWFTEQYPNYATIFSLSSIPIMPLDMSGLGRFTLAVEPKAGNQGKDSLAWIIFTIEANTGRHHFLLLDAETGKVRACYAGINPLLANNALLISPYFWLAIKLVALVTAVMAVVLAIGLCVEAAAADGIALGAYLLVNGLALAALTLGITQSIGWLVNLLREFKVLLPRNDQSGIQTRIDNLKAVDVRLKSENRTPQQQIVDIVDGLDGLQSALEEAQARTDTDSEDFQGVLDEVEEVMDAVLNSLDEMTVPENS